jgi:hypothetical protein
LAEIERIMASAPAGLRVHLLFVSPADWEKTDLWRRAAALPGVQVHHDIDGRETRRFGGRTSGLTLLYGPDGTLLFRGGVTGSRGHEGDNDGSQAVRARLNGETAVFAETPVFGCPLFAPETDAPSGP